MVEESKALVVYEGKPIVDIIRPLRSQQRDYIYLELVGMNRNDALALIDRTYDAVDNWRDKNDRGFEEIESYLLSNQEKYVEQAAIEWARVKRAKAILALGFIADKAFNWDKLDKVDKQSVITALRELKNIGKEKGEVPVPFEEMILRKYDKE